MMGHILPEIHRQGHISLAKMAPTSVKLICNQIVVRYSLHHVFERHTVLSFGGNTTEVLF